MDSFNRNAAKTNGDVNSNSGDGDRVVDITKTLCANSLAGAFLAITRSLIVFELLLVCIYGA